MPRFDPVFGLVAPELSWVPTPAHVIRRAAILDLLQRCPPGSALEMGCGSGALLRDLERKGWHGKGVDTSEHALNIAQCLWSKDQSAFTIAANLTSNDGDAYDYLMAFEVLEHIEDDHGALREWVRCLKKQGSLIISVPAHRSRWGAADEWAGHCRRYDHADIVGLLRSAGFAPAAIYCYGFPLLNVLAPISNFLSRRKRSARGRHAEINTRADATARSGADREVEAKLFWLYGNFASRVMFVAAFWVQRMFYKTGLGTGFLVLAKRR